MISWIARRWDATGQVIDGGIYTANIVFNDDGSVAGLAEQPREPLVRLGLVRASGGEPWWRTLPCDPGHR